MEAGCGWRLGRLRRSQTGLALHLGLDRSAVSRLLCGQRSLGVSEIAPVADYLSVAVSELLEHFGVVAALPPYGAALEAVGLVGAVDGLGRLIRFPEARPVHADRLDFLSLACLAVSAGAEVAEVRAAAGPLQPFDGGLAVFRRVETEQDLIPNGLFVGVIHRKGEWLVRLQIPAGDARDLNVLFLDGKTAKARVSAVSQVLMILPSW